MKREMLMTLLGALAAGGISAEGLTQKKLDSLLKQLAQKPVPNNLSPGAMCYMVDMPPERIEYVCPVCNSKTIIAEKQRWLFIGNRLGTYRRQMRQLKTIRLGATLDKRSTRRQIQQIKARGLDATLDERSLCETCRAKMKPSPEIGDFFIEVTIGGKTTRTKIEDDDFPILIAFLKKKDRWEAGNGSELPLKDELPRIRQLLGMPETTP